MESVMAPTILPTAMKPAKRHKDFPIGRVCMVCGKGGTHRLGGVAGFKPALLAAGYVWDHSTTLGMAHIPCITKALQRAKKKT